MPRTRQAKIALLLVVLLGLPSSAFGAGEGNAASQDRWEFDLALYLWLPTIEGQLGYDIPGGSDKFEMDPGTILDDLKMTGMLTFGARKDRWSAFADIIYLDLGDEKSSSVPLRIGSDLELDVGAGLDLKSWVVQVAGAYDVVRTDRANLGVLVGLRYLSMDTELEIMIDGPLPPELPTKYYSQQGELWDGIVGIKGQYGRKWYVPYYLDVGAGSSEFTWQALTGFGYRWQWGSVFAVYRYMSFDEGDGKFIRDLSFGGPAIGVNFRF